MREQCNRVRVRLYPLRGCVSVTVGVLGFAENVVGSVCTNLSVWKHLSSCLNISEHVCEHAYACLWRSNLWYVSSSWRGVGFACRVECTLKVLKVICYTEEGKKKEEDQQKPTLPYKIPGPQHTLSFHWHAKNGLKLEENIISSAS